MNKAMLGVGYVRVSTSDQVQEGVSLEAQQAKIRAWCDVNGYTLAEMYVDAGFSGGRADNRPALQMALTQACRLKAALVVYSLSRLARSTGDAIAISERIAKNGADLVSLSERIDTTSASGKMVFRMLAVLAEFERDQIAERTKTALAHLRTLGKRISGVTPFGWDLSADMKSLIPNPHEQEGLSLIRSLRAQGLGRRRIAAALAARGIPTKTGVEWSPKVVGGILRRDRLVPSYRRNCRTIEGPRCSGTTLQSCL